MMSYQHPTIYDDDTAVPLGTTTHDKKERVVPSGMMMESPSSSSPPLWKTKKAGVVLLGLLGLTAMVVASGGAALVFPSLVTSSESARTEEAFLLQARGGANDDTCVPATGPWPAGAVSQYEDGESDAGASDGPYVTCFTAAGAGGYCWSHSYYDDGDWKQCTPHGSGFSVYSLNDDQEISADFGLGDDTKLNLHSIATCGTGCKTFSSDMPT